MSELEEALRIIKEWAVSESRVTKVYLFGSRLKGTAKAESDLDIAVEITKGAGDTSFLAAFAFDSIDFLASLEDKLPFTLDLQLYAGKMETPKMHGYLKDASEVIYERRI